MKRTQKRIDNRVYKVVCLNEREGRWKRCDTNFGNDKKKDHYYEFLWVIENITKEEFDEKNWKVDNQSFDYDYGGGESHCICCHVIHNSFTITHIPTNNSFEVGSKCVKKVSNELYRRITTKKDLCKTCREPKVDKRTNIGKKGYCSTSCVSKAKKKAIDRQRYNQYSSESRVYAEKKKAIDRQRYNQYRSDLK